VLARLCMRVQVCVFRRARFRARERVTASVVSVCESIRASSDSCVRWAGRAGSVRSCKQLFGSEGEFQSIPSHVSVRKGNVNERG
jgi:hypothetical protein